MDGIEPPDLLNRIVMDMVDAKTKGFEKYIENDKLLVKKDGTTGLGVPVVGLKPLSPTDYHLAFNSRLCRAEMPCADFMTAAEQEGVEEFRRVFKNTSVECAVAFSVDP
eukprot:7379662-Prymnesium_polylepis.1